MKVLVVILFFMTFMVSVSGEKLSGGPLNVNQSIPDTIFMKKGDKGGISTKLKPSKIPEFEKDVANVKAGNNLSTSVSRLMKDGLGHEAADVFSFCFKALKDSKNEEVYEVIAKKIKSVKSPIALAACLNLLQHSNDPKNWKACLDFVDSPNRAVGHIATELAGQGVREAVPSLIKNLKNIKMRRMTTTLMVLNRLIGKDFKFDPIYFQNWWSDKKRQQEFKKIMKEPLERSGGPIDFNKKKIYTAGSYHGAKIERANSMFSLDTSLSMKPDQEYPRPEPKTDKAYLKGGLETPFPPMPAGNGSKIWTARIALATAIKNLHRKMMFGVITFGGQIDAWKEAKMYPASDRQNLIDAYTWVLYDTPLTLGTMLYQSIEIATMNDDVEVMYLLTDGAPAMAGGGKLAGSGSIKLSKSDPILTAEYYDTTYISHLALRLYETRRVTVHTFLIGGSKGQEVLNIISDATHGDYKVVNMSGGRKK